MKTVKLVVAFACLVLAGLRLALPDMYDRRNDPVDYQMSYFSWARWHARPDWQGAVIQAGALVGAAYGLRRWAGSAAKQ